MLLFGKRQYIFYKKKINMRNREFNKQVQNYEMFL